MHRLPRAPGSADLLARLVLAGWLETVSFALGCQTSARRTEAAPAGQPAAPGADTDADVRTRVVVEPEAVDELEVAFKRAVDRAGPAVVSVYTTRTRSARPVGPFGDDPMFEQLFGLPPG